MNPGNVFRSPVVVTLGTLSILLILVWKLFPGIQDNPWLVIYPHNFRSVIAIFTSPFIHVNASHLGHNLIGLWIVGLISWWMADFRVLSSFWYGLIYAGLAQFVFGMVGYAHMGSSVFIFAMLGVGLLSAIRKSMLFTLLYCLFIFFFMGTGFFDTIRPTSYAMENHISWLAHLGGLIGGMYAELNSPRQAVQTLLDQKYLYAREAGTILQRIDQGETIEEPADEQVSAPDQAT